MDSLELFLCAFLLQLVTQIILFVSWLFPISVAMSFSLLNDILWEWKESPSKIKRVFDWPLFLSVRKARMCNRGCLLSNMIGMLCTAFWAPSRAIQTIRSCPLPELFSFDSGLKWVFLLEFVVDLVEKRVDLGGSQFSESIFERCYSAHASQQNVVVLEFGSPCSPLSTLFAHDPNCHDQQPVSPFLNEVLSPTLNVSFSWKKSVWELFGTFFVFVSILSPLVLSCAFPTLGSLLTSDEHARLTLVSITRLPVLSEETDSSWKELTSISWERDVCLASCTVFVSFLITRSHRSFTIWI